MQWIWFVFLKWAESIQKIQYMYSVCSDLFSNFNFKATFMPLLDALGIWMAHTFDEYYKLM